MTDEKKTDTIPASKGATDFFKLCAYLYAVYAVSLPLSFWSWTLIPAMIAPIVALVLAYAHRRDAEGTPFESHLHWIIRTFWIGGAVYMPVLTVVYTAFVVSVTWGTMQHLIMAGTAPDVQTIMRTTMENNFRTLGLGFLVMFVPFGFWWLWRCWAGYEKLKDRQPMENVTRWF